MSHLMFDVLEHLRENLPRLEDVIKFEGDVSTFTDEEVMNHAFWLNDLLFICPPQAINSQTDQLVAKYQSLRSSASSKVPIGKGNKYFMVDLVIPAKSAILNVDYRMPDPNAITISTGNQFNDSYHNTGKRGGLLDLIIQFKNVPFARIENAFIRSTLGIPKEKNLAMCLHQLTVYTVRGKKGTLGCKLLISVFNYSPYSPNFFFKEDWVTKPQYGSKNFESVNRIDFGDVSTNDQRIPYKIYTNQGGGYTSDIEVEDSRMGMSRNPYMEADQAISPFIQNRRSIGSLSSDAGGFGGESGMTAEERSASFTEQYNLVFTENEDDMSLVDTKFMSVPVAVSNPAMSAVYKAYIDWLHAQWHSVKDIDGPFNAAAISPYGRTEQDLGDRIIFKWKEFKTEQLPPLVEAEIRTWYRRRMTEFQARLASRNLQTNLVNRNQNQSIGSPEEVGQEDETLSDALRPRPVVDQPVAGPRGEGRFGHWRSSRNGYNHQGIDIWAEGIGQFETIGYPIYAMYDGTLTYEEGRNEVILTNERALEIIQEDREQNRTSSGFEDAEIRDGIVWLKRNDVYYPVEFQLYTTGEIIQPFTYLKRDANGDELSSGMGVGFSLVASSSQYEGTDVQNLRINYYHVAGYNPGGVTRRRVLAGDLIGYGGSTGVYTSTPHLHLEILKPTNGAATTRRRGMPIESFLDPTPFVFSGRRSDVSASDARRNLAIQEDSSVFYTLLDLTGSGGDVTQTNPTSGSSSTEQSRTQSNTGPEDSRVEEQGIIYELIDSLPAYREFIRQQEELGWVLFEKNTLAFNIFYREKQIVISSGDNEEYPVGSPIVCDHISCSASNIIATIPMAGHPYPTSQFLGKRDDEFLLSFRAVGLNNIKLFSEIRDLLKAQAHKYKWIPEAWMVRVENNLINAFGSRYFVVNTMSEVTSPGQPNTYNIEVGIVSHPADIDQNRIQSMASSNNEEVKLTFIRELLGNGNYQDSLLRLAPARWTFSPESVGSGLRTRLVRMPRLVLTDVPMEQVTETDEYLAVVANPNIIRGLTNSTQAVETEGQVENPERLLYNWVNTKIASTINRINSLFMKFRTLRAINIINPSPFFNNPVSGRYLEDFSGDVNFFFANGCPNIYGSGSIVSEFDVEPGVMGSENTLNFSFFFSEVEATNRFMDRLAEDNLNYFRDPESRWSQREVRWGLGDTVARLQDFKFYNRPNRDDQYVDAILVEAYNYATEVHAQYRSGRIQRGMEAPLMDGYLDASPRARAFGWGLNNYSGNRENLEVSLPYFVSLLNRQIRMGIGEETRFTLQANGNYLFRYPAVNKIINVFRLSNESYEGYGHPTNWILPEIFFPSSIVNADPDAKIVVSQDRGQDYLEDVRYQLTEITELQEIRLIQDDLSNSFASSVSRRFPNLDYSKEKLAEFENYLWEQFAIVFLNNSISMDDINLYSGNTWPDGRAMFPETLEVLKSQRIGKEGPAYPDLMLPLHPFWCSQASNIPVSSIYTEPDFYLINYGIDTNIESAPLEAITDPNGLTGSERITTDRFIQAQAEYAVQSMDMLEGKARYPSNELIVLDNEPTEEGKSSAFLKMQNSVNRNLPQLFQNDAIYLRSEHGMGSVYSSGEINEDGSRTKNYSEQVRESAVSGADGGQSYSIAKTLSGLDPGRASDIGRMLSQSLIDSRFSQSAKDYFIGPSLISSGEGSEVLEERPQAGENNLNVGMNQYFEVEGQGRQVLWRTVISAFGPNTAFTNTPMSFNGNSYIGMGYDGYQRFSASKMLKEMRSENTDILYSFETETTGSDPSAFVNGNWGFSDIHQFSNGRIATYEKIRDALKGISTRKWAMRKAYPTFKVYFIEEDQIEREWIQYDDFYQYNQIQEIQISESRKRPAAVCTINFINVGGALDGNNQWHYWTRTGPINEYDILNPSRASNERRRQRRLTGDTTNSLLAGSEQEQNINSFALGAGVKLKIKLGYSNNPTKMEDVFLGSIAEIIPNTDASSIVIIAQSYGAELVEKPKGSSKEEIATTYYTTFDVLASFMFSPEVKHFGKKSINSVSMIGTDQSLTQNQLIYKNTVYATTSAQIGRLMGGIKRFLYASATLGTTEGLNEIRNITKNMLSDMDRQLRQIRVGPKEGPQDDNIFAPNYSTAELNYHWWDYRNLTQGRWRAVPARTDSIPVEQEDVVIVRGLAPGSGPDRGSTLQDRIVQTNPDPNFAYYEQISPGEIEYNPFYSSIWDIFQEMTYRHPGFVKHPRIYKNSNRMTMFFGLPDQKYWASEPSLGEVADANRAFSQMRNNAILVEVRGPSINRSSEGIYRERMDQSPDPAGGGTREAASAGDGNGTELAVDLDLLTKWMSLVQRRLKPFRNWYSVNSGTDIVMNNIEANKLGFYTSISLQFLAGASARNLKGALRRLRRAVGDDASSLITPSNFIAWSDREVEQVQAHRDMSPENIRQKFHQFANCRSRSMARRYARALLADYAKEMYKGSLLLLGNPKVKPYDVLIIHDVQNNVKGPIEVEEVIHNFNPMTGYTTEIIPDTFIVEEDRTAFTVWNSLMEVSTIKASRHLESILFTRDSSLPNNNAYNIIADRYSRALAIEREQTEAFQELIRDLRNGTGVGTYIDLERSFSERFGGVLSTGFGGALIGAGIATSSISVGLLGGVALLTGGALLGGLMSNYVNYLFVNYVHNNRAYFMIPLIRNNEPWTVGYDITATNNFYMAPFDLIRNWWVDGGEGITLSNVDGALSEQRIALTLSSDLNDWSRRSISWDRWTRSIRATLGGGLDIDSGIR